MDEEADEKKRKCEVVGEVKYLREILWWQKWRGTEGEIADIGHGKSYSVIFEEQTVIEAVECSFGEFDWETSRLDSLDVILELP